MPIPEFAHQRPKGMAQTELEALPVAFDLGVAARAFGMGRTKAYDLAKRGEFPCRVLRIGNAYRVTRADLRRSLGLDAPSTPATEPAAA